MSSSPLFTLLRDRAAVRRFSHRTVQAYARWVVEYVRFHGMRHPAKLPETAVRDYLTHLAVDRHVTASTQNQALAALRFLYGDVLEQPLPHMVDVAPARRPHVLPNVLSGMPWRGCSVP